LDTYLLQAKSMVRTPKWLKLKIILKEQIDLLHHNHL
jgi:hypothetical protein